MSNDPNGHANDRDAVVVVQQTWSMRREGWHRSPCESVTCPGARRRDWRRRCSSARARRWRNCCSRRPVPGCSPPCSTSALGLGRRALAAPAPARSRARRARRSALARRRGGVRRRARPVLLMLGFAGMPASSASLLLNARRRAHGAARVVRVPRELRPAHRARHGAHRRGRPAARLAGATRASRDGSRRCACRARAWPGRWTTTSRARCRCRRLRGSRWSRGLAAGARRTSCLALERGAPGLRRPWWPARRFSASRATAQPRALRVALREPGHRAHRRVLLCRAFLRRRAGRSCCWASRSRRRSRRGRADGRRRGLHLTERHEHPHAHEPMAHEHEHVHGEGDAHHDQSTPRRCDRYASHHPHEHQPLSTRIRIIRMRITGTDTSESCGVRAAAGRQRTALGSY